MIKTAIQTPMSKTSLPATNYLNRELSLLAFNRRVLAQAQDERMPLLERLRFLCIVSSNLDEFFEIRMAGIKEQIRAQSSSVSVDGKTPQETYRLVSAQVLPSAASLPDLTWGIAMLAEAKTPCTSPLKMPLSASEVFL